MPKGTGTGLNSDSCSMCMQHADTSPCTMHMYLSSSQLPVQSAYPYNDISISRQNIVIRVWLSNIYKMYTTLIRIHMYIISVKYPH